MGAEAALEVSKGDFAAMIGVSAGRVSQYISAGQLRAPALVGEGRSARINVLEARRQLRLNLDLAQRLGNGSETQLDGELPLQPADEAPRPPAPPREVERDEIAEQLREFKLRDAQRKDRQAEADELASRGVYVRADTVGPAMAGMAGAIIGVCESGLADLATALAAQFDLPQRDVLHALRKEFRAIRAKAADAARKRAADMPALVEEGPALEDAAA